MIEQNQKVTAASSRRVTRFLLLLACLACSPAEGIELPAIKPERGVIHRWITLPASLAPWQKVELRARVSGYVKSIAVDKGDLVKAGQQLAEIEVPELQADLIRHRATVAAAEVEVKRFHEARKKSPDLVLPQSVDDAEARLAIAKAGLERALTLLEFAQIKAPFSGVITNRFADPGAYAAEGGAPLLNLVDASTIRLQIPVIESESALVKKGEPVEASVDALWGLKVQGKVSRTGYALEETSRTLLVEADLPNPQGKLQPGMFATARLAVERHDNAVLIPKAGLVREKANAFVFLAVNGKAVKTPVKPAFDDGVHVEIPELPAGALVVLPGSNAVVDGQEISVKFP